MTRRKLGAARSSLGWRRILIFVVVGFSGAAPFASRGSAPLFAQQSFEIVEPQQPAAFRIAPLPPQAPVPDGQPSVITGSALAPPPPRPLQEIHIAPQAGVSQAPVPALEAPAPSVPPLQTAIDLEGGSKGSLKKGELLIDDEERAEAAKLLGLNPRMVGFELHREGTSWLVGNGDDFGMFSLESSGVFEIFGTNNLYCGHAFHFVSGPVRSDMPPRMFELYFGYRTMGHFSANWSYDVAVAPGIYTDFEGSARQGWRVRGRGVATYHINPLSDLVFGVVYLDRENLKLLPTAGLVIDVGDSTRLELMFPEPRITHRFYWDQNPKTIYFRGELGGGSWAIERDSRVNDIATYEDLRAFVGFEADGEHGKLNFFEIGYVFDRALEYRSGLGDLKFNDTVLLRTGFRF